MTRAMLLLFLPLFASAADLTGEWNLHLIRFGQDAAAARVERRLKGGT